MRVFQSPNRVERSMRFPQVVDQILTVLPKSPGLQNGNHNVWLAKARKGTSILLATQGLIEGALVVWGPAATPGLWEVTGISRWRDWSSVPNETIRSAKRNRKHKTLGLDHDIEKDIVQPRGKVSLRWLGGWKGYEGKAYSVCVKIEDVRLANGMEAIGLAAI